MTTRRFKRLGLPETASVISGLTLSSSYGRLVFTCVAELAMDLSPCIRDWEILSSALVKPTRCMVIAWRSHRSDFDEGRSLFICLIQGEHLSTCVFASRAA